MLPQVRQVRQVHQPPQLPEIFVMMKRSEKIKEKNNINITKKEVTDLLTQDSYYRKLQNWPLLILDDESLLILRRCVGDDIFIVSYGYHGYNNSQVNFKLSNMQRKINENFPNIDKLLLKFTGHLVVCGGAVLKAIFTTNGGDVDLFFYNLTIEEANEMRIAAIEYLVNLWMQDNRLINYHVKRNEYTTTLYITSEGNNIYEYQFIHRIYPDMSSIIGGFDLSVCMVAYDGKQIYATPLGAWSVKNLSIIIDTKRRSASFEYRLQKYNRGFQLIFPGISNKLVEDFRDSGSAEEQMISKIREISKDYGYDYEENWEGFKFIGGRKSLCSSYNIQKEVDILPYINLQKYRISTQIYDRKNIEDRLINKISDYNSLSSHPKCFADMNAQQLRSDNLHTVSSILKLDINKNIKDQLINDVDNPNLTIDDLVISKFNDRVDKIRTQYKHRYDGYGKIEDQNIDFYRLLKCFGKLTPEVIKIRDTDKYYEYRDIIVDKMLTNAEICMKNLIGVKWITQNPGRQWTSSINPIIADPREWYGKHYIPVNTGIPEDIETIMRLMRLERTQSVWVMINDDIFREICMHLLKKYADEAWKYI